MTTLLHDDDHKPEDVSDPSEVSHQFIPHDAKIFVSGGSKGCMVMISIDDKSEPDSSYRKATNIVNNLRRFIKES